MLTLPQIPDHLKVQTAPKPRGNNRITETLSLDSDEEQPASRLSSSSPDCITLDSDEDDEPPSKRARSGGLPSPLTISSAGTSPRPPLPPTPGSPELICLDD